MTPCFLLAPWANSNSLERTITRIQRAFPNRPYFLDFDQDYQLTNLESEPQRELEKLGETANGFENWIQFVEEHVNVWPCVQTKQQSRAQIIHQIRAYQALERPYCLRIVKEHFPNNIDNIVAALASAGTSDFAIILEGGWTRDPLTLAAWFVGILSGSLRQIDAVIPVVLSCTSIPEMFTSFDSREPTTVSFENRLLVQQVARTSNRARIIYGDWGSTRPRKNGSFASRPFDRVDYSTENAWIIARNKKDRWTFREAANAIVKSSQWDGNLGVWGEEMIVNTSINQELGIDTPPKNVAVRVNIHLHRQAFFGQPPLDPISMDEDWQD